MSEDSVKITCPQCNTVYALERGLLSSGRRAMKCAVCSHTFVAQLLPAAAQEPQEAEPSTKPDEDIFKDSTGTDEDDIFRKKLDEEDATDILDTDPDSPPVFGEPDEEDTEESGGKDLEEAWVDYNSVDIEDLTFGTDDIEEEDAGESLEFGDEPAESGPEPEPAGPAPEPQPPSITGDDGKIDASGYDLTLDGRPVADLKEDEELEEVAFGEGGEEESEDESFSSVPGDVEMPDEDEEEEIEFEEDADAADDATKSGSSPLAALMEAEQAEEPPIRREPREKPRISTFTKGSSGAAEQLEPSSGTIYYLIIMIIGAGGLVTNFIQLGDWRFDPVWSGAMILFGLLGFFLQNLSGIYIAGFFSIFYAFALFSNTHDQLNRGTLTGAYHIGVIFALAFILALAYALLIGRRSGHFVLQESLFQSVFAFLAGLLAILLAYWANINSSAIAPLGDWWLLGTPIRNYTYYGGVPLQVVSQAAAAAGAIAMGISAHRVRNGMLILAKLAILFGFVVILLLFAPAVTGPLVFDFLV